MINVGLNEPAGDFGPRNPVSMYWSIHQLDRFIKEFVKGTEYDTAASIKYISRELGMKIVSRTPIGKTQRAVAGWSAVGRALNFSVPRSKDSESGDSSYSEHLTGSNPRIEFSNEVPYIIYLEYGWSKQAPLGMVRISVAEVRSSGKLPALLARSYVDRWEGLEGFARYGAQEDILSSGLPRVRTHVPSRRSVSARLSAQLRKQRSAHKPSATLSRIQKSFKNR